MAGPDFPCSASVCCMHSKTQKKCPVVKEETQEEHAGIRTMRCCITLFVGPAQLRSEWRSPPVPAPPDECNAHSVVRPSAGSVTKAVRAGAAALPGVFKPDCQLPRKTRECGDPHIY